MWGTWQTSLPGHLQLELCCYFEPLIQYWISGALIRYCEASQWFTRVTQIHLYCSLSGRIKLFEALYLKVVKPCASERRGTLLVSSNVVNRKFLEIFCD